VARPRSFSSTVVVEAAKETFWERGYEGTAVTDLERATRLNRSSLYQAFGSKEELFGEALTAYIDGFMAVLLAPMERADSDVGDAEGFFRSLSEAFRSARSKAARRGCLWVNAIAELSGRPPRVDARADEYRRRLNEAFMHSLSGPGAPRTAAGTIRQRARLLVGVTIGAWVVVRFDRTEAALICDAAIAEIRSWRSIRPAN
jgi:TetR/AcrR family transcriptional repressor of nem operon